MDFRRTRAEKEEISQGAITKAQMRSHSGWPLIVVAGEMERMVDN